VAGTMRKRGAKVEAPTQAEPDADAPAVPNTASVQRHRQRKNKLQKVRDARATTGVAREPMHGCSW
jgi:hypothetical protein